MFGDIYLFFAKLKKQFKYFYWVNREVIFFSYLMICLVLFVLLVISMTVFNYTFPFLEYLIRIVGLPLFITLIFAWFFCIIHYLVLRDFE